MKVQTERRQEEALKQPESEHPQRLTELAADSHPKIQWPQESGAAAAKRREKGAVNLELYPPLDFIQN